MGDTKRVLLADADPLVWDDFTQALGQQFELVTAANGSAALAENTRQSLAEPRAGSRYIEAIRVSRL